MINFKLITQAVKSLLDDNLSDYTIVRNELRNVDPSKAARGNGWIGVYRGKIDYDPHTTGASPWLANVDIQVEVQAASMKSGADAEDKLQDAEQEVLDVLTANKSLNGTVLNCIGYSIEYEYNSDEQMYHHSATITIHAEARA